MKMLLPLLLGLVGLAGGIGAGIALKPAPSPDEMSAAADHEADMPTPEDPAGEEVDEADLEYVKLNNQFVVPVVTDGRVTSLVVMSISLQVGTGSREAVFSREPKLRDSFLQVLFDHANVGGFNGTFTTSNNLRALRAALLEAAQSVMGDTVSDILIIDMMRQDT